MAIVLKSSCTLLVVGGLSTASVAGLSEGGPMVGFHEDAIMTASDSSVAGWLGWDVDFEGSVLIAGAPRQGGGHAVVGYLNQWGALSTDELCRYTVERRINRCMCLILQPDSMNSTVSQSRRSGCDGRLPRAPKSSGVRTNPSPK